MCNLEKLSSALRSDKYKKGCSSMYRNGCYCVMGVACEVYQKEVGDLVEDFKDNDKTWDGEWSGPPDKVVNYFKFRNPDGELSNSINYKGWNIHSLMQANDGTDLNFQDIANIIDLHKDKIIDA